MMVPIPSGALATQTAKAGTGTTSKTMEPSLGKEHPSKGPAIPFVAAIAMVLLCAFQFGDRNGLNKMPFAKVQPLASDLEKAERLAKQGNIDLFAGQHEP